MKLRHQLLVARKYTKPDAIRGILVPDSYKTDHSRALWEIEETSAEANAQLQMDVEPGWIVVTSPRQGVFLDHATKGAWRYERFLLHADSILRIIPWTTDKDAMKTKGSRLLVKPDNLRDLETRKEKPSLIQMPDWVMDAKRPLTGVIVDVGDDVDDADLVAGVRVLYSMYAGTDFEINGERLLLMTAESAMMILDEDTEVGT